jgi:hypothetical protein
MTAQKMIELIQQHHPHIGETEALLLLNQAKDDFCQDTEMVKTQTTFTTTANQLLYSMPLETAQIIANGTFDEDAKWTKGTGWTIGSGVATATDGSASSLIQNSDNIAYSIIPGAIYTLKYTLTRSAGTITPTIAGTTSTVRSLSGIYTENITAGTTSIPMQFVKDSAFVGTIDNVSLSLQQDVLKVLDVWIGDSGSEIKASRLQGTLNIKDSV